MYEQYYCKNWHKEIFSAYVGTYSTMPQYSHSTSTRRAAVKICCTVSDLLPLNYNNIAKEPIFNYCTMWENQVLFLFFITMCVPHTRTIVHSYSFVCFTRRVNTRIPQWCSREPEAHNNFLAAHTHVHIVFPCMWENGPPLALPDWFLQCIYVLQYYAGIVRYECVH